MRTIIRSLPRDVLLFVGAVIFVGFAQSLVDATFNNYLNDRFALSSIQRTLLELPREIPGLSVLFVSALLFFLCNRTLAVVAQGLAAAGVLMIGLGASSYPAMLAWLFVFSLGQHLFIPLMSDIGMELGHAGSTGKRLGQLQGAMNLAGIAGSFAVFLGFRYLHMTFAVCFAVAALCFLGAMVLIGGMRRNTPAPMAARFTFRREYRLFYILSVLFGTRKQIFITFAPWVLVTVFAQPTQTIATLLTIGGVIGIFFKPALGRAIDRFGERAVLAGEAVVLVFVCAGYAFARGVFPPGAALIVVCACYVADQLLMSVGMARATYLKKIAVTPGDVTATLTAGVSIDHVFSIAVALCGGLLWKLAGYEYIFMLGALIALTNLFFALKVRVPPRQ